MSVELSLTNRSELPVPLFENTAKRLQNERDARIADLKSCLAMIAKFMDFEQRFLANASGPISVFPRSRTCGSFDAQAQ